MTSSKEVKDIDIDTETDSLQDRPYEELTRRELRSLIFHFLYAMDSFEYQESLLSIVDHFNRGFTLNVPLDSDVIHITQSVIDQQDKLDEYVKPFLHNWRFERIGVCTKLILRLALWELNQSDAVPNIVINEAIELAKCFAEKDAYKFINGILDEVVKSKEGKP